MKKTLQISAIFLIIIGLLTAANCGKNGEMDAQLAKASEQTLKSLTQPVKVEVFVSRNLSEKYEKIRLVLADMLDQCKKRAGDKFQWEYRYIEPGSPLPEEVTQYGILPLDASTSTGAATDSDEKYFGLVIHQANLWKPLPRLKTAARLEYGLIHSIRYLTKKHAKLSDLKDKITISLVLSSSIFELPSIFGLPDMKNLEGDLRGVVDALNPTFKSKLQFNTIDPSTDADGAEEAKKMGITALTWQDIEHEGKTFPAGIAYCGLMVKLPDRTVLLPVITKALTNQGYRHLIPSKEAFRIKITNGINQSLAVKTVIGFLVDKSNKQVIARKPGARKIPNINILSEFPVLISDSYSLHSVDLRTGILPDIRSLIITGPQTGFSEYELYQIDQFLMKGNSLALFLDAFDERPSNNKILYNRPEYVPKNTGLEKLLNHYGVRLKPSFILDKSCLHHRQQYAPDKAVPHYYAIQVKNEYLNHDMEIMKNFSELQFYKTSPLELNETAIAENNITARKLMTSSDQSWEMKDDINWAPDSLKPPTSSKDLKPNLAVAYMLEGEFTSYFADREIPKAPNPDKKDTALAGNHMAKGKPGKIFIIGSSSALVDELLLWKKEEHSLSNFDFIMTMLDYLSGNEDLALLRVKNFTGKAMEPGQADKPKKAGKSESAPEKKLSPRCAQLKKDLDRAKRLLKDHIEKLNNVSIQTSKYETQQLLNKSKALEQEVNRIVEELKKNNCLRK